MLGQIVSALLNKEDDFSVIPHDADQTDLTALIEEAGADVMILGSPARETPAAVDRLMKRHPLLKVFTITPNGRDAFRVELKPTTFPIREVSSQRLVDEIRRALAETPDTAAELQ